MLITCNISGLEYDIHSLTKAFFPGEDVKVLTPDSVIKDKKLQQTKPDMVMHFTPDQVELSVSVKNGNRSYVWNTRGLFPDLLESLEQGTGYKNSTYKNKWKGFFYQSLCDLTGKTLPWGNLTGIRPTKIAMTMLEEGRTEAEIAQFLKEEHFVSDEKIALSIDIAKREKGLLDTLHYEDGYSVYIGIPFCPTTCLYCSFTSFPICSWKKRIDDYLSAVEKEIDFVAEFYRDKKLDTIYIGGGTPTTLEAEELDRLLGKVRASFDFTYVKEFTVEAGRADSITREKLEVLYKHGVDRISVNPQTMHQKTLDIIGRRHTVEQVREAYQLAREIGFSHINMDIILGLPGETAEDVAYTIDEIKKLQPDSLTVHSLAIKRASRLHQWIEEHGIATLNNTDETMSIAAKGAADMGMKPYYLYRQKNMSGNFENVGYGKDGGIEKAGLSGTDRETVENKGIGKYGLYNILIMEEKQTIVALGAGTITKRVYPDGRIERCDNVKDVALYIEKIDEMIERKRGLLS